MPWKECNKMDERLKFVARRLEARAVRREIDLGVDPMAPRDADRTALKVSDLWERYRTEHLPRKSEQSQYDEAKMW